VELEVPVRSPLAQDFRDRRRSTLLDTRSVLSLAGGGSPTLALAPDLILEAAGFPPERVPGKRT